MFYAARLAGKENEEFNEMMESKSSWNILNAMKVRNRRYLFILFFSQKNSHSKKKKEWMINFLQRHGFIGVLLMSAYPNMAFDLCGIACGHFLMPFWEFFGTFLSHFFFGFFFLFFRSCSRGAETVCRRCDRMRKQNIQTKRASVLAPTQTRIVAKKKKIKCYKRASKMCFFFYQFVLLLSSSFNCFSNFWICLSSIWAWRCCANWLIIETTKYPIKTIKTTSHSCFKMPTSSVWAAPDPDLDFFFFLDSTTSEKFKFKFPQS